MLYFETILKMIPKMKISGSDALPTPVLPAGKNWDKVVCTPRV
jgi:hypothetical protein